MSSTSARNAGSSRLRGCGRSTLISATTRPGLDENTRMRSHISTASSMLCVTIRIALDRHAAFAPQIEQVGAQRFGRQHVERRERLVHQQDVGCTTSARAKPTRWRMPPDSSLRIGAFEAVEADQSMAASARLRRSAAARPAPRAPARRSPAPSARETARSSGTPSRRRRRGRRPAARDSETSPPVAGIRPAMMRSSVDLPEPERPSRPTISPSLQREVDVVEHQQSRAAAVGLAEMLDRRPAAG